METDLFIYKLMCYNNFVINFGLVAQLAAQMTLNHKVVGSIPTGSISSILIFLRPIPLDVISMDRSFFVGKKKRT